MINSNLSSRYTEKIWKFIFAEICAFLSVVMVMLHAYFVIANYERKHLKNIIERMEEISLQYQNHDLMQNQSIMSTAT